MHTEAFAQCERQQDGGGKKYRQDRRGSSVFGPERGEQRKSMFPAGPTNEVQLRHAYTGRYEEALSESFALRRSLPPPIRRIREPDAAASSACAQRKPCLDHPPIRTNGNQLANLTAGQKHLPRRNSWHVPRQLMTHPARPTPLGAQHGPVSSVTPAFRFPSL